MLVALPVSCDPSNDWVRNPIVIRMVAPACRAGLAFTEAIQAISATSPIGSIPVRLTTITVQCHQQLAVLQGRPQTGIESTATAVARRPTHQRAAAV